jgi:hypothetical protein
MPWVRFDDQYPIHRKVKPLSDSEMRFHIEAIFWCARNLTDGFVPAEDVSDVSAVRRPHKVIPRLVARGLLHEAGHICDSPKCPPAPGGEGWVLHDYWDYQPSKQKVHAEREAKRKRQERWLAKRNGHRDASQDAPRDAAPTRPAPKEAGRVPRSAARRREDGGAARGESTRDSPVCRHCGNRTNSSYHQRICAREDTPPTSGE